MITYQALSAEGIERYNKEKKQNEMLRKMGWLVDHFEENYTFLFLLGYNDKEIEAIMNDANFLKMADLLRRYNDYKNQEYNQ